jgi:O-antigen ligase
MQIFTILLIILFAGYSLLAWRSLRLALILMMGILPVYLLRFSIGAIPSTALEILILISAAIWLTKHKGYKIDFKRLHPVYRPLLLLFAAACFGVVAASDQFAALGIWKAYFLEPVLVLLMMQTVFRKEDWMRAFLALGSCAVLLSLVAIFQVATALGLPVPWDIERRAAGLFDYPNALGLFLAPIVAASTVFLVRLRNHRWVFGLVAAAGTVGIILAETEAAYIAIPITLLITYLLTDIPRMKKIQAVGLAAGILALLLTLVPSIGEKVFLQDYSGGARLAGWGETMHMFYDHPLVGGGLAGYELALEPYHDPTFYEIFAYPHNIFLNIWTELGLLGLLGFFFLSFFIIKWTLQHRNNPYTLAAFAALHTMSIHGLVDVPFFKNDLSVLTIFFLGMLVFSGMQQEEDRSIET